MVKQNILAKFNKNQIKLILKYWQTQSRITGKEIDLEKAAREWICKFSEQYRTEFDSETNG